MGKVRLSLKCSIFMMMNSSEVPMLMGDLVFSFISFIHSFIQEQLKLSKD